MVDMWGTDPFNWATFVCSQWPGLQTFAAMQLYSGFIFLSGEFIVWRFLFCCSLTVLDPELSGDESRRLWETQVVNLCFNRLLKKMKPSLALVSHWRECFWEDALWLFHSVNLNFFRREALSFYKVPFVVCFCIGLLLSQDRLPFVQYSGSTLPPQPSTHPQHALLKSALPVTLFSWYSRADEQLRKPDPKGKDTTRADNLTS